LNDPAPWTAVILLLAVSCALPARGQGTGTDTGTDTDTGTSVATETAEATASVAEANLAAFDQVWETIRDTHWDPDLGGVDWDAAREELRPSPEAAADLATTRKAIEKLLRRLEQSHFGLIPAEVYELDDEANGGRKTGWSGATFRMLNGRPVITAVAADSPAERAGIRPGAEIVSFGEKAVDALLELPEEEMSSSMAAQVVFDRIERRLAGKVGDRVEVTLQDLHGEQTEHAFTSRRPPGQTTKFGNLPEMTVDIETRMLDSGVGYIRFTMFMDPARLVAQISEFIREHADAKGLVIDIRGNPGGIGGMATGVAGWIARQEQQVLGEMQNRAGKLKFVYFRQRGSFAGPVAILVDERSMSTAEIFPGGLQDVGRCRVFGRPTPGFCLPSIVEVLPNGDRFMHAIANFVLPSGELLEGRGVTPDEVIELDRQKLAAGIDQDLEAAVSWIVSEAGTEPAEPDTDTGDS
jgi:carboxyl-terminal processing protease